MFVPPELLHRWGIVLEGDLGGTVNHHWTVRRRERLHVLRMLPAEASVGLDYELRLLDAVHARGWPVARAIAEPVDLNGATWCLFEHLDGSPGASHGDVAEQRGRGRLLAELHADLAEIDAGQRPGWVEVANVLRDPDLQQELRHFEREFPEEGRTLRWHAERALQIFEEIDPDALLAPRLVLHGDFVPWNLLYREGRLSGVLDFEAAHFDVAVADFALSWRGRYDGVVAGYDDVRPLTEVERVLITPAFWAWVFLGLAGELRAMNTKRAPPSIPEWSLKMLQRRSPLMGGESAPYRPRG